MATLSEEKLILTVPDQASLAAEASTIVIRDISVNYINGQIAPAVQDGTIVTTNGNQEVHASAIYVSAPILLDTQLATKKYVLDNVVGNFITLDGVQTIRGKSFGTFADGTNTTLLNIIPAGVPGTTTTIASAQTASRTYTIPDAPASSFVMTAGNQTLGGITTLSSATPSAGTDSGALVINAGGAGIAGAVSAGSFAAYGVATPQLSITRAPGQVAALNVQASGECEISNTGGTVSIRGAFADQFAVKYDAAAYAKLSVAATGALTITNAGNAATGDIIMHAISGKTFFSDNTPLTAESTVGALVVAGGLRANSRVVIDSADVPGADATSGALVVAGGARIGARVAIAAMGGAGADATSGALVVAGGIRAGARVAIDAADVVGADATSGALVVAGGIRAGGTCKFPQINTANALFDSQNATITRPFVWIPRAASSAGTWRALTYGAGVFVGVADSGTSFAITSPDGITWTARAAIAGEWGGIIYAAGLFVAVRPMASGSDVMTSPNGITWTFRATPGGALNAVVYGGDQFVAVGSTGGVYNYISATSTTGVEWFAYTASFNANNWTSIAYGSGYYVAVRPFGGFCTMRSTDGRNWTLITSANDALNWISVAYGLGRFAALAQNGLIMTSTNGAVWALANTPVVAPGWTNITFGNNMFVAVGTDPLNQSIVSADGVNWFVVANTVAMNSSCCAYGAGRFATLADAGAARAASMEAYHETLNVYGNAGISSDLYIASTASNALTVAGGITANVSRSAQLYVDNITDSTSVITGACQVRGGLGVSQQISAAKLDITTITSTTDYTFAPIYTNPLASGLISVAYGAGVYVAITGDTSGNVVISRDGIVWNPASYANAFTWSAMTYGTLFVAVASAAGALQQVMTSPNGITWTVRATPGDRAWSDITYGGGVYVAVAGAGVGQRVMTSLNGTAWTLRTSSNDNNAWSGVAYGGGVYVAVASAGVGRIMRSTNATAWTSITAPLDNESWNCVCYGGGRFVALSNNHVMTSTDGTTWSLYIWPFQSWSSIIYGNGLYVAVCSGFVNEYRTSVDGTNWTPRVIPNINNWFSVVYGAGNFVAVGSDGANTVFMLDAMKLAISAGGHQTAGGKLTIANPQGAYTDTTTGALVVAGGIRAGNVCRFTDNTALTAATDVGAVIITGGLRANSRVAIDSADDCSPEDTNVGALIVTGGARVSKRVYIVSAEGAIVATTTGALRVAGGIRAGGVSRFTNATALTAATDVGAVIITGGLRANSRVAIDSADEIAAATDAGALVVSGGARVRKSLAVDTSLYLASYSTTVPFHQSLGTVATQFNGFNAFITRNVNVERIGKYVYLHIDSTQGNTFNNDNVFSLETLVASARPAAEVVLPILILDAAVFTQGRIHIENTGKITIRTFTASTCGWPPINVVYSIEGN